MARKIICPECHKPIEQSKTGHKRKRHLICGYVKACKTSSKHHKEHDHPMKKQTRSSIMSPSVISAIYKW
jgi:hypothetical protein